MRLLVIIAFFGFCWWLGQQSFCWWLAWQVSELRHEMWCERTQCGWAQPWALGEE